MTTETELTVADIEAGYSNPAWGGFGYLGERERAMRTAEGRELAAAADAWVLFVAGSEGWTAGELFAWLDSKPGRWYGDAAFGGHGYETATTLVRRIR